MSSPMQKTSASRSISSNSASRMASRYVISGIRFRGGGEGAPSFRPLVRCHDAVALAVPVRLRTRGIGIDALQRVERLWWGGLLGFIRRCVDLVAYAHIDGSELPSVEIEFIEESFAVSVDGIVLAFPSLDLSRRHI